MKFALALVGTALFVHGSGKATAVGGMLLGSGAWAVVLWLISVVGLPLLCFWPGFYFAMVWFYLAGYLDPSGGGDPGFYWVAILVRVMAELYLAGLVVRDVLRPEHDPVRAGPPQLTTTRSNVVAV